ncbi:AraC family transcriptional regulator [Polyangium sp. 6x1]|uniref:helix-turn-helix transcriptional regulator n=1 Tax=Polyangium sp. 6x1 TaxID=3042689 RepID=UPI0024823A9D|nr:AraC family transcriptional regulator [Polyangium sp. 6x1]MDI1444341.1 AraC family transcriptional regulator [Polyangium sp. 6x1]
MPEREVETHTHDDGHFVLLLEGLYISSASGAPAVCAAPSLIYNPQGTTHRDRFKGDHGRFFTISLSETALRHVSDLLVLPPAARFLGAGATRIARRLAMECAFWDGVSPLSAEWLCLELLGQTACAQKPESRGVPGWLAAVRDLIHDRCTDDLGVGALAEAAGVHPVYLARQFRRHFHCSPGEYLRGCRLERAALLLRYSRLPLAEVALRTGFADQSHFTKAFGRAYRLPPRGYRAAHGRFPLAR